VLILSKPNTRIGKLFLKSYKFLLPI